MPLLVRHTAQPSTGLPTRLRAAPEGDLCERPSDVLIVPFASTSAEKLLPPLRFQISRVPIGSTPSSIKSEIFATIEA